MNDFAIDILILILKRIFFCKLIKTDLVPFDLDVRLTFYFILMNRHFNEQRDNVRTLLLSYHKNDSVIKKFLFILFVSYDIIKCKKKTLLKKVSFLRRTIKKSRLYVYLCK